MECGCQSKITNQLRVEGDIGADPIWCHRCFCNLNIEEVPISNQLKQQLETWIRQYGEWIDWGNDTAIFPNGVELEDKFNQQGMQLTELVREELAGTYIVHYKPSTFARRYANKKKLTD
ncbi:hypothetical protein [Lysinibacillus cavernae]|uniref:hypothetical protein n=1 Tax=Lysinibacillus cavernae TaxID=2666135 RepID=UPI0012D8634D|nr:hypothetical protein [Lysinibacillus cavernae]